MSGLIALLCLACSPAPHAQILQGRVSDQTTNLPLPAATVQIAGTFQGTITNNDGIYTIAVDELPVDLVVRYIGFRTDTLTAYSLTPLEFRLEPAALVMEQMVVTDEDPAVRIMRQVIERKQVWEKKLQTFEAQAYTRYTFSNDSGIVAISESAATAWWDHDRGLREKITGIRTTGNLPFEDALPAARTVLNLYNDDIEISGHTLAGVTHPEALDKYVFTLEGTRRVDDALVYDIAVEPKYRYTSGFSGSVSVMDGVFALMEARLRPGPAFLFPFPIQRYETAYLQQFSSYGGEVWLPVDLHSSTTVEISAGALFSLPPILIDMVSRFTDYQLNVALADSLFEDGDQMQVDSSAVAADRSFQQEGSVVPLTPRERIAYASIDSTHSLEEAYAPKGLLGRMINRMEEAEKRRSSAREAVSFLSSLDITPHLWYNRVDAFYGGLEFDRKIGDMLGLHVHAGLNTGQRGSAGALYKGGFHLGKDWFVKAGYLAENVSTYRSSTKGRLTNSMLMLLGREDYFDYYRREGVSVTVGHKMQWQSATITATVLHEIHSSLTGNVSYDFLGKSPLQRPNRMIPEGKMQTVNLEFRIGKGSILPIGPQRYLLYNMEISLPQSEYTFRRYYLSTGGRINTFLRRRFLPATLDFGLSVGLASGEGRTLPPQRSFIVEGGTPFFHWGGSLHTLRGLPYQGNGVVFGYWEHNFRTLPFELLGLNSMTRKGYNILIFGGHAFVRGTHTGGKRWVRHNEAGISLSGILGLMRLNFAYHMEGKRWSPSAGIASIF